MIPNKKTTRELYTETLVFKINTWSRSEVSVHPGLSADTTFTGGK